jgi:S-adenosylmethionine/arginine decarboxylase-like enzyme
MVLNLAREIGMTPLKHMHVELVDFHNPKLRGASAVALIAESHVAMHSWSEFNAVRVVIDSCKEFDIGKVIKWLGNSLMPSQISVSAEGEKRYVRPNSK